MSWADDVEAFGCLPVVGADPTYMPEGAVWTNEILPLRAVMTEAKRRGVERRPVGDLRPLTLLCSGPRRHRLGAVYKIPGDEGRWIGPVLVVELAAWVDGDEWEETTFTDTDPETGEQWEAPARAPVRRRVSRGAGSVAIRLDWRCASVLQVQCRCQTVELDVDAVRQLLNDVPAGRAQQVRVRRGSMT